MVKKLKKIVENIGCGIICLGLAAGLGKGCYDMVTDKGPHVIKLEEIDYEKHPVQIRDYSTTMVSELYAWDFDKDGSVDALGYFGSVMWFAPDYEDKLTEKHYFGKSKYARKMTPEMIEKVNELVEDHRGLSKILAEETHRQQELSPIFAK